MGPTAHDSNVIYQDHHLRLSGRSLQRAISASEIDTILVCGMEDEVHHGDEQFHIVLLGDEFALLGPFVQGAQGAIDRLIAEHPDIAIQHRWVGRVPYRYREPGVLGLRLFPVPGLQTGQRGDLARFNMTIAGDDA